MQRGRPGVEAQRSDAHAGEKARASLSVTRAIRGKIYRIAASWGSTAMLEVTSRAITSS